MRSSLPFRLASIIGARPQFIKAAMVSKAIKSHNRAGGSTKIEEILIHTGQHYDYNMSQVFFDQMKIPSPRYHLAVGSGTHNLMIGTMLIRIEKALMKENPDLVLVYGDTNSTLAGALSASKIPLPVAHVEAGLRSYNRGMPEEFNRLLTDHISSFLFCPTRAGVDNLRKEGLTDGVYEVGDVMYDAFLAYKDRAWKKSKILADFDLSPGRFCLATVHREENANHSERLKNIFRAFDELADRGLPFIVPIHPRTREMIQKQKMNMIKNPHVRLIAPVSYFDMLTLASHSRVILTDSGGLQKEAFFARVPCITLRNETEWIETVETGMNRLSGTKAVSIIENFHKVADARFREYPNPATYYGDGNASRRILETLIKSRHSANKRRD